MLGSVSDAEDAVQEASVRWLQSAQADILAPEAWLTAVTSRICLDRSRQLAVQRAAYAGRWLPDPLVGEPECQPDRNLHLFAELSTAFMLLLERLTPEERAAFLLSDVFDYRFAEIADVLGKSEEACRQLARRARNRIQEGRPRFEVSRDVHERLVQRFLVALEEGSRSTLLGLLAEDAALASDGGGKVKVSKAGIFGAGNITRLILHGRLVPKQLREEPHRVARRVVPINGQAGILTFIDGRLLSALSLATDGARILALHQVLNPDKLAHVTYRPTSAPKETNTLTPTLEAHHPRVSHVIEGETASRRVVAFHADPVSALCSAGHCGGQD